MNISVVIPTLNESANIAQLIKFIREFGGAEIIDIVVSDAESADNTCDLASAAGAIVLQCPRLGRAAQMNFGARQAKGDILYFVHADVQLVPGFVQDIKDSVDKGFDAGCYRYRFDSDKFMLKMMAFFTRFDGIMCRGGDQTLFVKRKVFETLGGFDEYYSIMEDYDFILRLRRNHKFRIIQKDIIVSARKYETNSWFRVQSANLIIFIMFFLKRSPESMKKMYKRLLTYR